MSNAVAVAPAGAIPGPRNRTLSIFLISAAALFLELLLIRWIGTEVRIFAYLQHTVLMVCFLGLGIGCFTSKRPIVIRRTLLPLLALTLILALPFTRGLAAKITELLSVLSDFLIWEEALNEGLGLTVGRVFLGLSLTFVLMALIWEIFVPLGRILGRLMDDHPNTVWAYSVNVSGSLVGIWLFVALSGLSLPPVVWMFAAAAMLVAYLGIGRGAWLNFALLALTVVVTWFGSTPKGVLEFAWSPYQKLVLYENQDPANAWKGELVIDVNNVGYQGMVDLSERGVAANPNITPEMAVVSQYDIPLLFKPNPERVLIVGAGSGNDVAGALRGGAKHVTAVDIDPVIIDMGRRYHPEKPYDSDRVTVVNDDARSFFARTTEKYDLIIFGLLDSHTMTSMTNARLDHYVYTKESLSHARSLLKEGGVISLNFMAHRTYISDRINRCLTEVFGREPLSFVRPTDATGWGGVMFVTGDEPSIITALATHPQLALSIAEWQELKPLSLAGATEIATDDWPYLYLDQPRIPTLYGLIAVLMLVLLGYARYRCKTPDWFGKWHADQWHFFFLGAAFLLLEVQNISKASVVLGNTWVVNAVIISGILFMVLLANLIATKIREVPIRLVTFGLVGTCIALYFVDLSMFGFLPFAVKAPLIGVLTTLPMLFSGLLFIDSFAKCEFKGRALGANLMGSLVGGILQALTFVVGVKALLLIVAALYLAALVTRPSRVAAPEPADESLADAPAESDFGEEPLAEPASV